MGARKPAGWETDRSIHRDCSRDARARPTMQPPVRYSAHPTIPLSPHAPLSAPWLSDDGGTLSLGSGL